MIKKLRILFLTSLITLFSLCPVYATNVNSLSSNYMNSDTMDTISTSVATSSNSISTKTSTSSSSSLPEADLGFNNILCILLIVIGIVLVLLGIAVLIRLNK